MNNVTPIMPFRFVYRTAKTSVLSCSLDSADICVSAVRYYTNVNEIVDEHATSQNLLLAPFLGLFRQSNFFLAD